MPNISLAVVVDGVVKVSTVLAATALVAAALRRASASARHLVWTLGLVSALAVPALGTVTPRWELPIVRVSAPAAAAILPSEAAAPPRHRPSLSSGASSPTPIADVAPVARNAAAARQLPGWPTVLLIVWAAGAAIVLGRMLLGLIAVQWLARRTAVAADAPWLAQARSLAADLGLARVRFLRAAVQSMPMAWGIFRPAVLIPADADTWPAHRLRVVLLHELAHVKRRDCLTHLVAQIACAAYWFNPLAWMAARRLRTERERACDDLVLASGTRGSEYADQLLEIARVMRAGRFPALFAGASLAMAQRSQLEGRLMAILDPSVPRRGLTRARAAAAAVVFALLIFPVAAIQPWTIADAAAVKSTAEDRLPAARQAAAQKPDKPIESYPGQAEADTRANAKAEEARQRHLQTRVQDDLQGAIQSAVQGGIQGGIEGGVQAGIPGGIRGGVGRGIGRGVGSGIGVGETVGNAVGSVASGVVGGIASAVGQVVREVPVERAERQGRTVDPRTVNALMEALKDTDKDVRETAMHALVQMRDPRIFEPLVQALKDASADVREQAAFGLGQLRDARAIDPLSGALKDQNASVREQAVFALGQLRAAATIDAVASVLHDASPDVREQAAFALGQIRDRRAVEPLISVLKDEKPSVREQAAFALGQLRDAKAVEALVIALKDANVGVREQAAFALGQIRDPRGIDGLTAALKDASASVRQQAAFALGQIR
ncbi:MAG TPA: M56 family metallopeptidase [Vicinamibacterales bacterium]|nr:M56 family metallopeptidase [Vicinamibacterales bacterium]